jgi:hypothetical protein
MLRHPASHSRRQSSRFKAPGGVWVYWACDGRDKTSLVRNLGAGGLFIETTSSESVGVKMKLAFLVEEGRIRVEAVVRHLHPGQGVGAKFTAIMNGDRLNMTSLLNRLRRSS